MGHIGGRIRKIRGNSGCSLWVRVHGESVGVDKIASPVVHSVKPVVEDDEGSVALAEARDLADNLVGFHVPALDGVLAQSGHEGLVEDAKEGNNVLVLRLRDELGERANVIKCALHVGNAHGTGAKADVGVDQGTSSHAAGVVPPVLRARDSVKIKVDAEPVLAGPFDGFEEVAVGEGKTSETKGPKRKEDGHIRPRDLGEVRLVVYGLNGPPSDGAVKTKERVRWADQLWEKVRYSYSHADKVEASCGNLHKVVLRDKRLVMLRHLLLEVLAHGERERPLVDRRRGSAVVFLVEAGDDEWLCVEPATEVNAPDLVLGEIEGFVEPRRPAAEGE